MKSWKEVLTVYVSIEEVKQVEGRRKRATMISFGGHAKSEYFEGDILAGGVDTQYHDKKGRTRLSARYIIKGKDKSGNSCSLFIENNGKPSLQLKYTKPMILTDSVELAWLEHSKLSGTLENREGMVIIHILAKM